MHSFELSNIINGSLFCAIGVAFFIAYIRVMYLIKKNVHENIDMEKHSLTILLLFFLLAYIGRGIFTFTLITEKIQSSILTQSI